MHTQAPWRSKLLPLVITLAVVSVVSVALAERLAPSGSVTPKRGPLAGQPCRYGDGLHEYFYLADYTAAELESFIQGKKSSTDFMVLGVLKAIKERSHRFDGQFSKEGYEHYKELVLACLEDGKVAPTKDFCRQRAPYRIGIDIFTGKVVSEYTGMNLNGFWILEPGWAH
ncbi:MAG TPA: hypothetical protein VH877_10675 [Polyangia bacterium]|jgi:hypothetical protein|nr:hypothetical protein [Polyangia bacterium]